MKEVLLVALGAALALLSEFLVARVRHWRSRRLRLSARLNVVADRASEAALIVGIVCGSERPAKVKRCLLQARVHKVQLGHSQLASARPPMVRATLVPLDPPETSQGHVIPEHEQRQFALDGRYLLLPMFPRLPPEDVQVVVELFDGTFVPVVAGLQLQRALRRLQEVVEFQAANMTRADSGGAPAQE